MPACLHFSQKLCTEAVATLARQSAQFKEHFNAGANAVNELDGDLNLADACTLSTQDDVLGTIRPPSTPTGNVTLFAIQTLLQALLALVQSNTQASSL